VPTDLLEQADGAAGHRNRLVRVTEAPAHTNSAAFHNANRRRQTPWSSGQRPLPGLGYCSGGGSLVAGGALDLILFWEMTKGLTQPLLK